MSTLKLFITGDPGCGKTTLVREVARRLGGAVAMRGFFTEAVLEVGRRRGFQGVTLDGRIFPLADRSFDSELRVGPYGVTLEGLESVGLDALTPAADTGLILLDEVGKMESFSTAFRERVEALLAGDTPVLGTVAGHGVGFVKRVRRDARVTLVRMRVGNRRGMAGEIVRTLARAGIGPHEGSRAGTRPQDGSDRP